MQKLTKDNFKEALTGKSLVFFHRLSGCSNCDKVLPKVEAFTKDGVKVYDVDCDTEKDLVGQYAPQGQWNLPLTVYFENGEVINTRTGIVDPLEVTKTLQNISEMELAEIKLNLDIEFATKRKEMFKTEKAVNDVAIEVERRQKGEEPVAPKKLDLSNMPEEQEAPCDGCQ